MQNFIKGMDLSTLVELERCGAKYYDNGKEEDILSIMKKYDVDTIRIRLWNDPWGEHGESYGAGENDLKTSLEIAKRVTAAGFGVLLNFHYSDFWADPGKQFKPKAWANYGVKELEQAVYDFTKESMEAFLEAGVNITMVQVGNELSNGLLWPEGKVPDYDNIATFVNAGIRAVREVDAQYQQKVQAGSAKALGIGGENISRIPVMLHLDNGGNNALYREWFDHFMERGEDFEIIGLSYYPFWHGTLDMLTDNMNDIAQRYGKKLIVAEVSMGYTMEDYKDYEKLADEERKGYATRPELVEKIEYPMTKQGQADFMKDFLNRISHIKGGLGSGFFYWEPAWIPVSGSGWATPASLAYIKDPGPCGNEWANQALFDYEGNTLPALGVIRDFTAD
jgi:arabinogalactan endo-1,4-beta-galactosidase